MKSNQARILLTLTMISLSIVLNIPGRPLDQPVRPQPVQPKPSPMLTGVAQLPAESMFLHPAPHTSLTGSNTFKFQTEPQWKLGTNTLVTGLIVDCLAPQQSWQMLNPSVPAKDLPRPPAPSLRPIKATRLFNNDLVVHESDFALLRFSFGPPPKVTKPQP